MDGKLNAAFLRQLEEDASALLGDQYAKLVAQRTRGLDSKHPPTNPHRLVDGDPPRSRKSAQPRSR